MEFDYEGIALLEEYGDLDRLVLHEIGHVLGFGTLWSDFDLLRLPTGETSGELDTHFTGPLAIEAFDRAASRSHAGNKVPVENYDDAHWRESVLQGELMTTEYNPDTRNPLSAITVQSLADMGYVVDPGWAEPYRLPLRAAPDAAEPPREADYIDFREDILKGPLIVVDRHGRVVRVIPR